MCARLKPIPKYKQVCVNNVTANVHFVLDQQLTIVQLALQV
jgi:hypothetical protein